MTKKKPDGAAWARAQVIQFGNKCLMCQRPDICEFVRGALVEVVKGRTRPGAVTWGKIQAACRAEFDSPRDWKSVRNHFRDHEQDLYAQFMAAQGGTPS